MGPKIAPDPFKHVTAGTGHFELLESPPQKYDNP